MPEEVIYLIAAFVLVGGVVLYLVLKYEQERREAIRELAVRELFKPRLLEYFQSKKMDTTLEGRGNGLLLFRPGKRLKPDDWETRFNQFREMVNYFQSK